MPSRRIPALAFAADVVAVVVFAGVGRSSHAEADDLLGLARHRGPVPGRAGRRLGHPGRAGAIRPACAPAPSLLAGTAVHRAALRARLHRAGCRCRFAVVATVSLAVLLLGWRALSLRGRAPAAPIDRVG